MHLGEHHIAQHHFFRIKFTELNELYTVMSLRAFIISLVTIFIPIYLYNLNYSIQEIIFFYILIYIGEAIFELPITYMIAKFGPKHLIATSLPFLILHFLLLLTLPSVGWPLWFVAVFGSISLALFWQAYNYDFSKSKHKINTSKEVSWIYILIALSGALGPFIGGSIATIFGIQYVYGLTIGLLFLAIIPLFKTGESHVPKNVKFSRLKLKDKKRQMISYGGAAIESTTTNFFWPLFVFFIVGTYQSVGLVTSLALVLTVAIMYFVGKFADKGDRSKYIRTGSFLNGLIYFVRAVASSILHVFSLNMAAGVSHAIFMTPFVSEYYLHADEESRLEYISVMELSTDIVRILGLLFIYAISFYLAVNSVLVIGLIMGGMASFLIGLMPPTKREIEIKDKTIKVQRMIRASQAKGREL